MFLGESIPAYEESSFTIAVMRLPLANFFELGRVSKFILKRRVVEAD